MPLLLLGLALVLACASDPARSDDPGAVQEINGTFLDSSRGYCVGGISDGTSCAGNPCTTLDEVRCGTTGGCFIGYTSDPVSPTYRGCFPVLDNAPPATGSCAGLDDGDCAGRDDCAGIYAGTGYFSSFMRCEPDRFDLQRHD